MKVHAKFMLPDERGAAGTARSRRTAFTGIMDCLKFRYATAEPLRRSERRTITVCSWRGWPGPPQPSAQHPTDLHVGDVRTLWNSSGVEQ